MSLHVYNDLEQGTEEWLAARRGMVTASTVGQLLTATGRPASNDTSRRLTLALVAERITGETEPVFMNDDMLRGHLEEPIARDMYAEHFSGGEIVTETGFMVRDDHGFPIGYSPDGLVGDNGLIEIKAPRAKGHIATILSGTVPDRHMAQIQAGLLVSGRDWCDFISYYGGLPPFVKRVHADLKWAESIVTAVADFEEAAADMTRNYDLATRGLPATERRIELDDIQVA
jgi:putative phage-type endonuclease